MYVPLYIKTNYSLLSSLISIKDLIKYAKENNFVSLAITDNNMYGSLEFYYEAKNNNIKPILGIEVIYKENTFLLYAKDYTGYLNLIKIITIFSERALNIEDLEKLNNNLICIIPFSSIDIMDELKPLYNDLFIGISNNSELEKSLTYEEEKVYLNKTLYLNKEHSKYLEYLYLIRDNKTINDNVPFTDLYNSLDLKPNISKDLLDNTIKISEMCNLEFPKYELNLPIYKETSNLGQDEYLSNLAMAGLKKRLNNQVSKTYLDRLLYELDIIKKMGFSNYFLVVYDFIKYAKKNNILVGPGRGSAAGSLVSYSLGITDIDPIKYDLLFERFLNIERITMPDIDIDFPDIYRDQVIDYVRNKYGIKNVASIITFGTLAPKQAIRDTSRVLNIPLYKVDALTKLIPISNSSTLNEIYKNNLKFKSLVDENEDLSKMFKIASFIEGFPRHTSIHAAGVVMSEKPLDEIIPLVKNNNFYLTGYTSEYLESLGLLKMDFLGIRNLTTIMEIIKDIYEKKGVLVDFNKIPLDDKATIEIFKNANTNGIFQFESVGMKNFLRNLAPSNFDDICSAIALFRPGPAINIDSFIRRKHGKEEITYLTESLKPILESTYGIIVYQEQIMLIANVLADYSLGEADVLRRAMSKKKFEELKAEEDKFISRSIKKGLSLETAKKIFEYILNFASYGFNKSHSVAYSIVAYKMAYLKAHYKEYFYANLLTSVIGSDTKTKEYIYELKSLGLKIIKPNINISTDKYIVVGNDILYPLSNIKNIGNMMTKALLEARSNKEFSDIYDFFARVIRHDVSRNVIESLIDASALDDFGYNHQTLYHNLDVLINYGNLAKDIPPESLLKPELIVIEEFSKDILINAEKNIFGLYLTNHPTQTFKLNNVNIVNLSNINDYFNKEIYTIIIVDKIKEIVTKNNDKMAFVTGSDEEASIDYILFPEVYKINSDIKIGDILKIKGRVEKRLNQMQIIVINIERLKSSEKN